MTENDVLTDEINEIPEADTKEILESVSLSLDKEVEKEKEIDIVKPIVEKPKKNGEDDEAVSKALYDEFSIFLEDKAGMKAEVELKKTIPVGIDVLDAVLGGGFAIGALSIIVGQPGSGKSMLAIQALAQGQKEYNGQMVGGYLDSEESTTSVRLSNLGVRYPKIKPYSDITVEKVFKFLEGVCLFKEKKKIIETPSMVIWDSIANTLSEKEREAEDVNQVIGYKARMLSILIPKYVAKCGQHNISLIAVNQLRDVLNIGQFAPPRDLKFMSASKSMPGGNVLKFNAFHLLEMKLGKLLEQDKYGFDGVIAKVKCVKNKLFPPNIEVELLGSFTTGFSNFWTNYHFLINTKRLSSGAWNYLVNMPDKKFRTKDAEKLYNDDIEFEAKFDEAVKESIQTEIVEKYNPDID
jgi:RecA/RadA recombinase